MDSNIQKTKLQKVLKYVKNEISRGRYPSYKELKEKFNIPHYKITLRDIYPRLGIRFLELPFKRPQLSLKELREDLIAYIRSEVKKGHYPTRRYIERKFKITLTPIFKSISNLYSEAGIEYKQENSQELKNKKAKILTNIVIQILPKLGLEVLEVRKVHNRGVDLITSNYNGEIIGVEVKAHNKYEPIKRRNFLQLIRFLKQEKLSKIILITTTSKFENNIDMSNNVEVIDYEKLKELCDNYQLEKINYIRNASVHKETKERHIKKQKIIDYTRKLVQNGEDITYDKISKDLNLHAYTYFNTINDIYIEAGLLPPIGKIGGRRAKRIGKYYEDFINKILEYMKKEILKGYYPSGIDVGKKFGVKHIWNFITMTELYERLRINPYKSRNHRFKEIKQI